jgi:ParB-like chromosome segregation protein Spo0J
MAKEKKPPVVPERATEAVTPPATTTRVSAKDAADNHGGAKSPGKRPRGRPAKSAAAVAGAITVRMLPAADLQASPWNPNVLTDEAQAQLTAEVRRLGRPPKPIVVRAEGKHYVIVDGEHAWKAAREAGLAEVPCEVIEGDDFEALRQMLARNQHGENDPVKLGRLYQEMRRERELSLRALAEEIGVSEGTVRNFEVYAEAAELRNGYAEAHPEGREGSADAEVARLSVEQARAYVKLPAERRDEWLDGGANPPEAERLKPARAAAGKAAGAGRQAARDDGDDAGEGGEAEGDAAGEAAGHPDDDEATASASAATPADQGEPFDPAILDRLDGHWRRANRPTREKFLAGVLADPATRDFARRVLKQGA